MMFTTLRHPATRAGFFFTVHCLFRSGPHRVVMAGCTAVALALSTVLLGAGSRSPAAGLSGIPVYVFATQTISLAVMLFGFVHATRLPADVTANRLFRIAWIADGTRFVTGVRRAAIRHRPACGADAVAAMRLLDGLAAGDDARPHRHRARCRAADGPVCSDRSNCRSSPHMRRLKT